MNDYEAKQEARRLRLEQAAANARDEATSRFQRAHDAVSGIPFGQPILIGHHSEKRHRKALERQDTNMRKGCEASDRAAELEHRAAAVGSGGISSDDPGAVEKLGEKRTTLEIRRDAMKSANAFYRKHKTLDGWDGPAELAAEGMQTLRIQPYYNVPFPGYALQNIGARIRQANARAEQISERAALAADRPTATETIGTATITQDASDNRVLLQFPARLSKPDYQQVRSAGFVWSPTRKAFVRKLSATALYYARDLAGRLPSAAG